MKLKYFILLIGVVALLIFLWLTLPQALTAWDFRNNLWSPARLLVHGQSPYLVEQLFPYSNAVWMPTIIGVLFPLGWISERDATLLWLAVSLVCVVLIYHWSVEGERPPLMITILMLVGGFAFPPTISHIVLGQFSLFAGVLLIMAAKALARKQFTIAGLCLALAVAKPQLILLPAIGMLTIAFRDHPRNLIRLLGAGVIASLILLIPLWVGFPNWAEGMQTALLRNNTWAQPSSFIFLRLVYGNRLGISLWLVIVAMTLIINQIIWRRLPVEHAMNWSIALNLLMTPYLWSWDMVLLLPLLYHTFTNIRSVISQGWIIIMYIMMWLGMVQIRLGTEGDDIRFWWVPSAFMVVVLIAVLLKRINVTYGNYAAD